MSDNNNARPDSEATSPKRDAVAEKVLDGADEVTRQKMGAMLERSSVVEVMAQAHASGKPAGLEDRPIKPDFLNTEQYQLARKAIGAKGEPTPTAPESPPATDDNELPPSLAPTGKAEAQPSSDDDNTRSILAGVAIVVGLVVAAIMLWPREPSPVESAPHGSGAATPGTQTQPRPEQPQPAPSPAVSTAPSATTSSPQSSAPHAVGPSPSPKIKPLPPPSAKPAATPAPTSTSRFPVQGDD